MGKDWDAPWKSGAGMTAPGIGDRPIPWPTFTGGPFGGANPTCATCGGRARGAKKCECEEPDWRVAGEPLGHDLLEGVGFSKGGSERFSGSDLPTFSGTTPNFLCRKCKGSMRGRDRKGFKVCKCDDPDFPSVVAYQVEQKRLFQAWCVLWLRECFRVLQPGGLIKVFGATRMFHRMAAAMEEAGFLIPAGHALEAWGYGCLTDDAEILTENGWKLGVEVQQGERVACWDSATGAIKLDAVQEVICKPYEGEMVVFRNDNTDQVLTPNHRVYKKHRIRKMVDGVRVTTEEPEWSVQPAGEINRWNNIRLPLAGLHDGPGIGGEDWARLLAWVWTEGGFDQQPHGVRIYQSSVNMEHVNEIQALLDRLVPDHKCYPRERTYKDRTYTEFCWFFAGEVALKVRAALPEKRPTWDLLWGMTQAEKHAFVDAALKGDGWCNRGRWAFYQKHQDDLVWFQTLAHLMNRQGRVNFRKRVVGLHMNPQTQLQGRHLRAAVSEYYEGDVWCVRVPTGAFVARRADKVFITGNSGFPKYLNTAKAVDKHFGCDPVVEGKIQAYLREQRKALGLTKAHVDREVFGGTTRYSWVEGRGGQRASETYLPTPEEWADLKVVLQLDDRYDAYIRAAIPSREHRFSADWGKARTVAEVEGDFGFQQDGERWTKGYRVTEAATEEAARFEGWATALKPGWEPFVVGMRPT